jgi:hypothetical protein
LRLLEDASKSSSLKGSKARVHLFLFPCLWTKVGDTRCDFALPRGKAKGKRVASEVGDAGSTD